MHRVLAASTALLLASTASPRAHADDAPLPERASAAVTLEGLFGYHHTRFSPDRSSDPGYSVSQFGGSITPLTGSIPMTRLAVHAFLPAGVTLGVRATWVHLEEEGDTVTVTGVEPRIGYALGIDALSTVWLRGGVGYEHWAFERDLTVSHYPLGVELSYVLTPVPTVGVLVGPSFSTDVGLGGDASRVKAKHTTWGLSVGLLFGN